MFATTNLSLTHANQRYTLVSATKPEIAEAKNTRVFAISGKNADPKSTGVYVMLIRKFGHFSVAPLLTGNL